MKYLIMTAFAIGLLLLILHKMGWLRPLLAYLKRTPATAGAGAGAVAAATGKKKSLGERVVSWVIALGLFLFAIPFAVLFVMMCASAVTSMKTKVAGPGDGTLRIGEKQVYSAILKRNDERKQEFVAFYQDRYGNDRVITFIKILGENEGVWSQPFPNEEGKWRWEQHVHTESGEQWSGWLCDRTGRYVMTLQFGAL